MIEIKIKPRRRSRQQTHNSSATAKHFPITTLSDFTYGFAPQPIVRGIKAAAITQDDLSRNLQRLKADGYTHYEITEDIFTDGTPVYTFTGVLPLEERLRQHVARHFFP
mgnify:CR=1 FL=1